MNQKDVSPTIRKAFQDLYDSKKSLLPRNQWVNAAALIASINLYLQTQYTSSQFNNMIRNDGCGFMLCERFDGNNETGLFRVTHKHTFFYYVTKQAGEQITPPDKTPDWYEGVKKRSDSLVKTIEAKAKKEQAKAKKEQSNSNPSTDATPMDTASKPAPPPQQPDPPGIRSSPRLKRKPTYALSPIELMDGKRLITQFEQSYIPPWLKLTTYMTI
jgi:hypothetical protein